MLESSRDPIPIGTQNLQAMEQVMRKAAAECQAPPTNLPDQVLLPQRVLEMRLRLAELQGTLAFPPHLTTRQQKRKFLREQAKLLRKQVKEKLRSRPH